MWLKRKLGVAADILYDYGWRVFLFRAVPWLLRRRYFVYAGRIQRRADDRPADTMFRLEAVRKDDVGRVVRMRPDLYNPKSVSARLEQGHLCFLGWRGRMPVHVRWLFTKPIFLPYVGRTLVIKPGEAYSDESYTLRKFRRLGMTGEALGALGRFMDGMEFHRFIALVATWNTITIRLLEAHGLKRVGECGPGIRRASRTFFARGSVREGEGKTICVLEG